MLGMFNWAFNFENELPTVAIKFIDCLNQKFLGQIR